jgi:preprotein translocase subunit SecG
MSIFNFIWLLINIILVILILIRSPNEQSFQETIGSFKIFESSKNAEETIDNLIQFFIIAYFVGGFLLTIKAI